MSEAVIIDGFYAGSFADEIAPVIVLLGEIWNHRAIGRVVEARGK